MHTHLSTTLVTFSAEVGLEDNLFFLLGVVVSSLPEASVAFWPGPPAAAAADFFEPVK